MRSDFAKIRQALSEYAREHRQYSDSLEQVPELKDRQFHDPWGHPYHYNKTATGYSLLSLGRDGKPGGVGLDSDIDSEQERIRLEPTLSQFLFDAKGSRTLLNVAILASCFAGLACYIASGPHGGRPVTASSMLLSIGTTIVGAILVSLFLVFVYTIGEHH